MGKHLEVELVGCVGGVCFTLKETAELLLEVAIEFCIPTSNGREFQMPWVLTSAWCYQSKKKKNFTRCVWYLIMVLFCISLVANDIAHPITYLLMGKVSYSVLLPL